MNIEVPQEILDVKGFSTKSELNALADLASFIECETGEEACIMEIGTYLGRTALAMAYGTMQTDGALVFTVDPRIPKRGVYGVGFSFEDMAGFYENMVSCRKWSINVYPLTIESHVVAKGWEIPVGLLFIDGDHDFASSDFVSWVDHLTDNAVVVFHDSSYGKVAEAISIAEGKYGFKTDGSLDSLVWMKR